MRYAVHAEWTKLRSLRGTLWLVLAIAAVTVAVSAATVAAVDTSHCPTPAECFEDTVALSLKGVWLGQTLVVVFAALAISNEYGTGMIHLTLMANPRRHTVLLSKAAVVVAAVVVAGALGVLGSLLVGRIVLPTNGFNAAGGYPPLSIADGPTLRAAVGSVLYLALIALLSLGAGAVIRDTAGTITAMLSLLYVAPLISAFVTDPRWLEWIQKLSPTTAGLAIQATTNLDLLPIGPWPGLGVLAAYAAGAMLVGGVLFVVRDA